MTSIVPFTTIAALLVAFTGPAIQAQRGPGSAPSRGPGWLPRRSYVDAKLPAAELAAVRSRFTEIERLILQVDALAHPVDFEIEPIITTGRATESFLSYRYEMMFYSNSKRVSGEGNACVSISINDVFGPGLNAMEGYRDAAGQFWSETPADDPIPGATHVWNRISPTELSRLDVMFTSGRVSPFEPVTRERFQQAKIRFFEALQSTASTQTPYEKWMAEAPQRKAARDGLRSLPKEQAAAIEKAMDDAEREASASLKASDAADRAEAARQVTAYRQMAERARADLAAMPPAERPSPAWIEQRVDLPPGESRPVGDLVPLVPAGTPLAARVVTEKLDFYRGLRPRVNPRVIRVKLSGLGTCNNPKIQPVVFQTYKTLDWAALARLIESNGR